MTLGDTTNQRHGQKINMTHLHLKYAIYPGTSSTDVKECRITVVYDSQTCGAAPTYQDVWAKIGSPSTKFALAHRNLANIDRFDVLYDQVHYIRTSNNGSPVAKVNKCLDLHLDTRFNEGNAGTVADISSGSIYLIAYTGSDNTMATDMNANITFFSRIQYLP